jgi:SAM-dependent methyltransferase
VHDTAYIHGRIFRQTYWSDAFETVVEIGSQDVNGSLRSHFPEAAKYIGLDFEEGAGVDVLVTAGAPLPLDDESADIVLTSSAFEHDQQFWVTMLEMCRVLRPGGVLYINAPSNGEVHLYPIDAWRFYPDAGLALARWSRANGQPMRLLESFVAKPGDSGWADNIAVFQKDGGAVTFDNRMHERSECLNVRVDEDGPLEPVTSATYDMQTMESLRAEVAALRAELEKATNTARRARKLRKEVRGLRKELAAIQSSTSWAATAPLRKVTEVARKTSGRIKGGDN